MADLKIKIKGESSGLKAGLASAKNSIGKFSGFVKRHMVSVGALFTGAAYGLVRFAKEADNIAKASRRMGVSTSEFQRMAFAAERTGTSAESVEKSFRRMQRVINDAGNGLATAKRSFDQIGVSLESLKGKSPEQQFQIIARALAKITDKTKQAAVAQEIFGRSGTSITPLIQEYDKLVERFEELGGGVTDDAIENAEKFNDAITDLQTSFKSLIGNTGILTFFTSVANAWALIASSARDVADLDFSAGVDKFAEAVLQSPLGKLFTPDSMEYEKVMEELNRDIKKAKKGAPIEPDSDTEGIDNQAKRLLMGGIGGGGTLASLGGDISGGGFASRMGVQYEQLTTLKEIKSLAEQLADSMGVSGREAELYLDTVRDLFKD